MSGILSLLGAAGNGLMRGQVMAAQAQERQRKEEEARQLQAVQMALQGVFQGQAPPSPGIDLPDLTAAGGLPSQHLDTSGRYRQVGGYYIDNAQTPQGRRAAERAQTALAQRQAQDREQARYNEQRTDQAQRFAAQQTQAQQFHRDEMGLQRDRLAVAAAANQGGTPGGLGSKQGTRQLQNVLRLQNEYTGSPVYKQAQIIATAYRQLQQAAAHPSPAGDISLVYQYMKLLDPNSSVREGEYANARNAGGVPAQVQGMYNKLLGGGFLAPQVRADFVKQASAYAQAQQQQLQGIQTFYGNQAQRYGIPVEDVVIDPYDGVFGAAADGAASPGAAEGMARLQGMGFNVTTGAPQGASSAPAPHPAAGGLDPALYRKFDLTPPRGR